MITNDGTDPDPQTLATVIRDGNYDFPDQFAALAQYARRIRHPQLAVPDVKAGVLRKPIPGRGSIRRQERYTPFLPRHGMTPAPPISSRIKAAPVAVSASPSASGTATGGGTFASGSSDTVTATANSGYVFSNWTENGTVVSTAASYTFTLSANRNLVANFTAPVNYTVAVSASPSAGGTVTAAAHSRPVLRPPSPRPPIAATRSPTGPKTARWSAPGRATPSRSRPTATW